MPSSIDTIGIALHQALVELDHAGGIERPALAGQDVAPVREQLAGGDVEREARPRRPGGSPPASTARARKASASSVLFRLGAKPPSSPTLVLWPASLSAFLQAVEDLRAHAQAVGEGLAPHRHDHEFLHVDRVVGVRPAIDHVHHRHRQHAGAGPADIAPQRQALGGGRRLGDGEADAEDGVGAEAALVVRAVERAQAPVDADLVERIVAEQRLRRSRRSPPRPRCGRPCRRAASCRRRAARPPRACRSTHRTAPPPGRGAPLSSSDVDLDGRIAAAVDRSRDRGCVMLIMSVLMLGPPRQPCDPQQVGGAGDPERHAGGDGDEFAGLGEARVRAVAQAVSSTISRHGAVSGSASA